MPGGRPPKKPTKGQAARAARCGAGAASAAGAAAGASVDELPIADKAGEPPTIHVSRVNRASCLRALALDARAGRATLFGAVLFLSSFRAVYFIDVQRCAHAAFEPAASASALERVSLIS